MVWGVCPGVSTVISLLPIHFYRSSCAMYSGSVAGTLRSKKSFKLTVVGLKWRRIQQLLSLFLALNVFRNTFRWNIFRKRRDRIPNEPPLWSVLKSGNGQVIMNPTLFLAGESLSLVAKISSDYSTWMYNKNGTAEFAVLCTVSCSRKNQQHLFFWCVLDFKCDAPDEKIKCIFVYLKWERSQPLTDFPLQKLAYMH